MQKEIMLLHLHYLPTTETTEKSRCIAQLQLTISPEIPQSN